MKLFKIWQDVNNDWDTYSDAIVVADNEEQAKTIHPSGYQAVTDKNEKYGSWCSLKDVQVEYIGEAKDGRPEDWDGDLE